MREGAQDLAMHAASHAVPIGQPISATLGCRWKTLALMGARHLISPRWLKDMR